mmetsp:Transcript_53128/g.156493  ORF Transcript_53128/g.156493 Transcript_53128/m.156493 type:complete len:206 (+) Transcript_53128:113-730(+)
MSFDTVCFSMNSLMSRRTIASSEPKKVEESVLQSCVLPTPVGPENMKLAMGRLGFRRPARARRSERETAWTASSCPMTDSWRISSSFIRRADSVAPTCSTAMPVQPATTEATSASVTRTFTSAARLWASSPASTGKRAVISTCSLLSSAASSKRSSATASWTCCWRARASSTRGLPEPVPPWAPWGEASRSSSASSCAFSLCAWL